MKICKELEQEFDLIPLKKGQRESEAPTQKVDYKAGDLKHQIGNVTKSIMANYNFQSFGEYRTLLEQFNITAEEIKGEYKDKPYQGLTYSVLDKNGGEKVSKPFKSSLFGKSVNNIALQKHFETSRDNIENSNIKERLKPIIGKAMRQPDLDTDSFRQSLLKQGIGCIFRQNGQGRIYGVTFIDYSNRTILNGSRLGKEFSANTFNDLFKDSPERNIERAVINKSPIVTNRSGQFTESSGVPQSTGSDSLGIGLFEQHSPDFEAENFAREKERKKKSDAKNKKDEECNNYLEK